MSSFVRGGNRLAVFVLELELPRAAVAGEVEHVVGVPFDRRRDDLGMAHLEDANLDVLMPLGHLHRVEDVLQLPLVVEHGGAGVALIEGADRDEDLDRSRQRWLRLHGDPDRSSHRDHGRDRGEQAVVRQSQRLEGQAEQLGVVRLEADLDHGPHVAPRHQVGDGLAGLAG